MTGGAGHGDARGERAAPRNAVPVWLIVIAGLLAAAIAATSGKPYLAGLLISVCLYAFLGVAWNLAAGIAGVLSLGHSIFIGIGAYTVAYGQTHWGLIPWITWSAGAALSAMVALVIGYACFRFGLRGYYLAICTLAFGQVAYYLASASEALGRSDGMIIPNAAQPLRYWQFDGRLPYAILIGGMLLAALILGEALMRARAGYYWRAIHEDEDAAATVGVPVFRYKLLVFALSAGLASLGGSFYATYFTFVDPRSLLSVEMSVDLLVFAIVGGLRLLWGPVLGAALLIPLASLLSVWFGASAHGANIMIYALVLIVVALKLPNGLGPALIGLLRIGRRADPTKPAAPGLVG